MKRVIEIKNGKLGMARHLCVGQKKLYAQDKKNRRQFHMSGVTAFLVQEFGLNKGMTIYNGLKKVGIIRSLGRHKQGGRNRLFCIVRKPVYTLPLDYQEVGKLPGQPKKRSCTRRMLAPIVDDDSAIRLGAQNLDGRRIEEVPQQLWDDLMSWIGCPADAQPDGIYVKLIYKKK